MSLPAANREGSGSLHARLTPTRVAHTQDASARSASSPHWVRLQPECNQAARYQMGRVGMAIHGNPILASISVTRRDSLGPYGTVVMG